MDTLHSKNSFVFNIWGFLKPYAQLMRLERPIGTWLCLLPSLWGLALASPNLNIFHITLFFIGATLMRGAGCTINDLIDRNIDKKVIRTKNRPLAAGHISPKHAIIFLGLQLALAFGVLLLFNKMTVFLGLMIALPIGIYPLMKRITFCPQIFLGIVFNWGCLMGWSSIHNSLSLSIVLLYLSCIFWTVGYDTIYAFQDYEDDLAIGMKSSALKIGKKKGRS
ncbi:4-hydroxybenzoate octaprenyltransferase, partial [Alphaproteobacteria bacterium]|nr:4-hydroxybenzoate octaprenyltransferase [Alphaproteobacteria bacterium]